jgi:hypothetical protein
MYRQAITIDQVHGCHLVDGEVFCVRLPLLLLLLCGQFIRLNSSQEALASFQDQTLVSAGVCIAAAAIPFRTSCCAVLLYCAQLGITAQSQSASVLILLLAAACTPCLI